MHRRPPRRFAWIALLTVALALPGPVMTIGAPTTGAEPFFVCTAGGPRAGGDSAAPRDSVPDRDHPRSHDHCPLCLTPAPAATGRPVVAAAAPLPTREAPAATWSLVPLDPRPLARVRAQPPPAVA